MAKTNTLLPYDGERYFWQWDIGRKLVVNDAACCQVHFCNKTDDCALVCLVYEFEGKRVVDVPNILLQTAHPITAFTYVVADDGRITTNSELFKVIARNKPDDYVYTEIEVLNFHSLSERLKKAVLYDAQNLTEDQKAQARKNIGVSDGSGGLTITDDGKGNVTITSSGSVTITDDGNGNVTIA